MVNKHVKRMKGINVITNKTCYTQSKGVEKIKTAIDYLRGLECFDTRQQGKVKHKLHAVIGLAFFAMVANANDPEEIESFGEEYIEFLREYFELENGIPSHDTIERVFAMIAPEYLTQINWKRKTSKTKK